MKIDKDFAVRVEDRVFTANEISSVNFDIDWFKMNCISKNGTKFTVEASLKDVEFLTDSYVPEIITRNIFGEVTREKIFSNKMPPHSFCVEGDSIWDIEIVSPLPKMKNAVKKSIDEMGKEHTNDAYGNKVKASDATAVKAMKDAADAISKAAEAICKATEQIKVELSIDGEKFSKLIKKYNQDITRSGR